MLRKGARSAEGELALGKKGGEKCEGVRVSRWELEMWKRESVVKIEMRRKI